MPEIQPPPLRNDCFALPPGVDWTPVAEAKRLLRDALSVVVSSGHRSRSKTPVTAFYRAMWGPFGRILRDPIQLLMAMGLLARSQRGRKS